MDPYPPWLRVDQKTTPDVQCPIVCEIPTNCLRLSGSRAWTAPPCLLLRTVAARDNACLNEEAICFVQVFSIDARPSIITVHICICGCTIQPSKNSAQLLVLTPAQALVSAPDVALGFFSCHRCRASTDHICPHVPTESERNGSTTPTLAMDQAYLHNPHKHCR